MTSPISFTAASIARAIKGVERAGRFVVGVRPDGTLIVGDKLVEASSLVPVEPQQSPPAPKRPGDYFNGGEGKARGA